MSSEKQFEKRLIADAKKIGYWAVKLNPTWNKGLPDRLFLGPNKTIVFMELKTPIGRAGKMQEFYIRLLQRFGFNAQFVDNYDRAIEILVTARLPKKGDKDALGTVSGWPVLGPRFRQD